MVHQQANLNFILGSLLALSVACAETAPDPVLIPPQVDASSPSDTGVHSDARTTEADAEPVDVGPSDSGIHDDASAPEDAMVDPDAGETPDSGEMPDAGTSPDAGAGPCGCAASEYCQSQTSNSCSAPGTCLPRPSACAEIFAPVCGCDKTNYSNECEANSAGVDISHDGDCDCRDLGCGTGQWCQPCRTTMGVSYVCLPMGAVC